MNENDDKVTFELSELSYEELVNSYEEILDFISYLEDLEVEAQAIKVDKEEK